MKTIEALLEIKQIKKINTVLGGAYLDDDILNLAADNPKIKTHRNLSEPELVEVMNNSNFGIAPASTILYELCCIKMPILSGYYVENQKNVYYEFSKKGAIFKGGDFSNYTILDFKKKIEEIIFESSYNNFIDSQKS
ncbi:hypothetical protein [Winogradskyella sp. UBA3174]|uniref:hypothetical protein n=1 Tax=Winogradskyella sp. UBA3174 TaxID=1947785 RepID=UPI0025F73D73|nr:hypothetical protein [Winogradskyella sp. UBA3174]